MRKLLLMLCGILAIGALAQPASAKPGLYAGFCTNPDDFMFGFKWMKPLENENLWLAPSVEAGFGDVTMIAGNFDLHYRFKGKTKFYAGGGATLNWFDFDGGSDTEFGGSILGGVMLSTKSGKLPYFEAKLGLGDVPDWKFLLGLNF